MGGAHQPRQGPGGAHARVESEPREVESELRLLAGDAHVAAQRHAQTRADGGAVQGRHGGAGDLAHREKEPVEGVHGVADAAAGGARVGVALVRLVPDHPQVAAC